MKRNVDTIEYLFYYYIAFQVTSLLPYTFTYIELVFMLGGGWWLFLELETDKLKEAIHGVEFFILFLEFRFVRVGFSASGSFFASLFMPGCK